jgi:hypothetical protein
MASASEFLTVMKARREELRLQKDRGELMSCADGQRQAAVACGYFFSELERWERESPPSLAGLDTISCAKALHAFTEGLRKSAKAKFEEVGQ